MAISRLTDPFRRRPSFKALRLRELLLVSLAVLAGLFVSRFWDDPEIYKESRLLMGTLVEIQILPSGPRAILAADSAFQIMKEIDRLFRPMGLGSELASGVSSAFEQATPEQKQWLQELLDFGMSLENRFPHAFHLGMEELTTLWNFESALEPPDSLLLLRTLGRKSIRDNRPASQWGFGALAKGFAVDKGLAVLKEQGFHGALINAGGDLASFGKPFIVGIQHPRLPGGLLTRLHSTNQALATSGDYECYFVYDEQRFHHLLDPITGRPAGTCQSITVAAPSCMEADAWATALFVMPPQTGLAIASREATIDVLIVDADGQELKTQGFALLEEDRE